MDCLELLYYESYFNHHKDISLEAIQNGGNQTVL